MGEKPSFLVPRRFETGKAQASHWLIRADARNYMCFAKDCGARPVSVLVSACAKAVLKVMGKTEQSLRVAVPVDFREALEIPHTFRNCAMPPLMLDLAPELANGDIRSLAAAVQQIMNGMTTKATGVMAVKAMADRFGQMPSMPYRQGAEVFRQLVSGPMFTFNASYARRFPEAAAFTALVDSAFVFYPSGADQMVYEMIALPESFCICLSLGESTRQYAEAFCEVLSENGITCSLEGVLSGNRGYVELREYEQW